MIVSDNQKGGLSRRELMKKSSQVAAASALAGVALPQVHAGGSPTIQVALVGCGGRGTGAASDALSVPNGNTRLIAMADVVRQKLDLAHNEINRGERTRQ